MLIIFFLRYNIRHFILLTAIQPSWLRQLASLLYQDVLATGNEAHLWECVLHHVTTNLEIGVSKDVTVAH